MPTGVKWCTAPPGVINVIDIDIWFKDFLFRLEAKKKLAELKEKFSLEDDFDDLDFGEDDSEENSDLEDTED